MAEYIEREAFLADKKWLYCTDCDKRKGKKRGKMVTLYKIGEAPCKSCGIHDMFEEVEVYPAADVRPVVRGIWEKQDANLVWNDVGLYAAAYKCNRCGELNIDETNFCPNCGAMMEES